MACNVLVSVFQLEMADIEGNGEKPALVGALRNDDLHVTIASSADMSETSSTPANDTDDTEVARSGATSPSASSIDALLSRHDSSAVFTRAWTAGEVRGLEGGLVRTSYVEQWGAHTQHNAVVMSATTECQDQADDAIIDCPEVSCLSHFVLHGLV